MTPTLAQTLWRSMALLFLASNLYSANLLQNGDFSSWSEGRPADWNVRSPQQFSQMDGGGMQVKVVKATGRLGEVLQRVSLTPEARYRVTADIRADKKDLAFIQVKLYRDGKEMSRSNTKKNKGSDWNSVTKVFQSSGADHAEILLRWKQSEDVLNKIAAFRNVVLEELPPVIYEGAEVGPRAVPTFHSVGLYWKPTGGTANRSVEVEYRKKGESEWMQALPLWFDTTHHTGSAEEHFAEYRGSIVYLDSGTEYEARLQLQGGIERTIDFATLSEDFRIARTVKLPSTYDGTYVIDEGGSEEDGYVLYEPEDGSEVFWDANNQAEANLRVDASWVIVRGLNLTGAIRHGIVLSDVQHVVIEDCDLSNWGKTGPDGQAENINSAIYSNSKVLESIIIQNNEIHHPRSDSNSWQEKRPGTGSRHPQGPQGITLRHGQGHYIVRYNRFYSDMEHMFNDSMGEFSNSSYGGFPNRDSDVYGNFVSHCWDDGVEIEGANMNVRVWDNYIDTTYGAIGSASTSLGPVYYFRNVYGVSQKHHGTDPNDYRGHYLVKIGNENPKFTKGKIFVFHNTVLQPPPFEGFSDPSSGAQSGIVFTSPKKLQENITSRNNIFQMRKETDWAVKDTQLTPSNDYDYDLYTGQLMVRAGAEENGIHTDPVYDRSTDGRLWLRPGTAGFDQGERIPNFNDDFVGEGPDIGAVETGSLIEKPMTWPEFPENYHPQD
ncbi:right-handed parallel beta-helix repeat-containing protein [Puniceicoccus vermicola]|uniref:Right-handed parallel beta-helix repeat-containing protein n=1 Tax=Puniceicoccus vermicola TaxID=388746 RepID=A0A7X1B1C8_9BACT|nr:right-handed parallel beta-helix repeat-containing protein [Puniceicoccus vermicola]MBC2603811.1 right-handed parallel beta-helix repeat-containing protein [Puniceicoccus vermicola]